MFNKILIANRGEIACRVIKTARKLGVRSVAVYSDADKNALHVCMADEAIHIGAAPSRDSYLRGQRIIEVAKKTGAQAIHPGYGFLSENAEFCELCADNDLVFIGPPVKAIQAMGSKSAAKNIMQKAGVPLVPGYHGDDQTPAILKQAADDMGYPVLLKAVAGGGGKGMRQVWKVGEFDEALAAAKREAMSSFNNDDMLVEKYLTQPRHVEVQVFCDSHGNGVYLFERDCSVQRRHQKVIEEAPAPGITEELRKQMGDTAVRAAQAIDYRGAGTVEFLLDVDGSFYFMEMNTRLQVEHPVTEMITGQDLVEWQLRVANGEKLPLRQQQLTINGHAFEARVYAEDPKNDFLPETGTLSYLHPPQESKHVRVDTGVVQGDEVSVYYDPMIAKLIVWDENRSRALSRLCRALDDYHVCGVTTNINFLNNLAGSKAFLEADLDTGFIEKNADEIFRESSLNLSDYVPMASLYLLLSAEQNAIMQVNPNDPTSPWNDVSGWQVNAPRMHFTELLIDGESYPVKIEQRGIGDSREFHLRTGAEQVVVKGFLHGNELSVDIDGHHQSAVVVENTVGYRLFAEHASMDFEIAQPDTGEDEDSTADAGFTAPMNGTVVSVNVEPGAEVKQGDVLLIMEAMKMEHAIRAPSDGKVTEIYFTAGDLVDGGVELLVFEQAGE